MRGASRYNETMKTKVKIAVSMLLLACLATGMLVGCEKKEPEPPYNWNALEYKKGRYYYYGEQGVNSRFGVDVSEYQGHIDWKAAANDGVEFALIRVGNRGATEGQLYADERFSANLAGAQNAGIMAGVYFFSQAVNAEEAVEEANFVLEQLDGANLEYPVVFDHEPVSEVEGRANKLSGAQVSECAKAFMQAIERGGYETMIYGNNQDLMKLDQSLTEHSKIWFAEYDVMTPTVMYAFNIWQYANDGVIAGIETPVDMNIHFLAEPHQEG